jgi:hypothetical protein
MMRDLRALFLETNLVPLRFEESKFMGKLKEEKERESHLMIMLGHIK